MWRALPDEATGSPPARRPEPFPKDLSKPEALKDIGPCDLSRTGGDSGSRTLKQCGRVQCEIVLPKIVLPQLAVLVDLVVREGRDQAALQHLQAQGQPAPASPAPAAPPDTAALRAQYERWRTEFKTWGKWAPIGQESKGTTNLITVQPIE